MDTIIDYLHYGFVQNALMAGTLAAILGAVVGYFVVLRNLHFAAHALSHIGFTGAAAVAALPFLGLGTLEGVLLFTVIAALAIGFSGDRLQQIGRASCRERV